MSTVLKARGGRLLILIAGLLGFGLILYGVWRFSAGTRDVVAQAMPAQQVTQVVTAASAIERGQVVQASALKSTAILGAAPPGALTLPAQAVGKVAVVDIQPQQLVLETLVSADPGAAGLAMLVPVGQRVLSIDTTDEIAVSGFVRPGDTVDIQIVLPQEAILGNAASGPDRSESRTLLQNIRVLTVGPTLGQPGTKDADGKVHDPVRTLTLAMNPDQAAQFTLARKLGRFFLLLRNPGDGAVVPDFRAGLGNVRGGGGGVQGVSAPGRVRQSAAPRAIELIVGGERRLIYPGAGR